MSTTYQLIITEAYRKRAGKFLKSHPDLLKPYQKTLTLLELYKLEGRPQGLYSVSISWSYRITLEFLIEDKQIILVNVGSHDSVY